MQSKYKIQKYSYLSRIILCKLVNEAKQRLSLQREPFSLQFHSFEKLSISAIFLSLRGRLSYLPES